MVDAVLSSLNLARYFDCIITGCEVAAGKPSPDIYLEAARRMKSLLKSAPCSRTCRLESCWKESRNGGICRGG